MPAAPDLCARAASKCIFLTYIVSLAVYPDVTAWLRPAHDADARGRSDARFPFGARLRGDLLVPLTFVIFNAVRGRGAPGQA
jgi:hypothetical protein